jgi:hypothetical protein
LSFLILEIFYGTTAGYRGGHATVNLTVVGDSYIDFPHLSCARRHLWRQTRKTIAIVAGYSSRNGNPKENSRHSVAG